jgi:putative oxidoreductase
VRPFADRVHRRGERFAFRPAWSELIGGLLVALGLFGPAGPALFVSVMIVAAVTVHWHGIFAAKNGVEIPLLIATLVLLAGAAGGVGNLALRRPAVAEPVAVKKAA